MKNTDQGAARTETITFTGFDRVDGHLRQVPKTVRVAVNSDRTNTATTKTVALKVGSSPR